nr:HpcH/HpaI aldolase/citrate lyase family protein [Tomitella biformata]
MTQEERTRLFFLEPEEIGLGAETDLLAAALGATLYSPGIRENLAEDLARLAQQGVASAVVCLEDAVADSDLAAAERNTVEQLRQCARGGAELPLVFVRVRSPHQIPMIMAGLGVDAGVLAGFVLPKFTADSGIAFLEAVAAAEEGLGRRLLAMPVLETPEVMSVERRVEELLGIRALLDKYRANILAVRIGATDLSAIYGLRRSRELTVYDVRVVADAIADIVNVLGRADSGYVVTGAVWEYFTGAERLFKPLLRRSPFAELDERPLRAELLAADLDGLLREVALDKANGLIGKTVIHPSHVGAVHALSVVTHEEYSDAMDIVGALNDGGVAASSYGNKMNEGKPHTAWAMGITRRARAFGVANEDTSFVDLLAAGLQR